MRTYPIQPKTQSVIRLLVAMNVCSLVACGGGKTAETPVAVLPPVVTPPIVPPTNTAPIANAQDILRSADFKTDL